MSMSRPVPPRRPAALLPPCDHRPRPSGGLLRAQIRALRREYLNPGIMTCYDELLCLVEGHMQHVWDEQGCRYLAAAGGIVSRLEQDAPRAAPMPH
jgi:hypothetical protein